MNISIIIPNYNGAALLKKNLPKVFEAAEYYLEYRTSEIEIIIVDDCSEDNSIEEIKNQKSILRQSSGQKSPPKGDQPLAEKIIIKYLKNEKNLGFASTVNRGVKESGGGIIVLLNTDVRPENNFLIPLVSHFEDENVFAVGCMDKSIEKEKEVFRGRGLGKWDKGFLAHSRGEVDKTNTLWVAGGSGAFRKNLWQKLGGFNSLYNPFYWEDIDISYRALKFGYKILFDQKSIVVHRHEEGAIKNTYSTFRVKTIAYRNQFLFVWINVSDLSILFSHVLWLTYHLLKMLILRDWAFYVGFVRAFINIPKVLASRKVVQRNIKISDRDVMSHFVV